MHASKLNERIERQFDKWAPTYEAGIWSKYFRRSHDAAIALIRRDVPRGGRIVDLSCGTGMLSARLASEIRDARVIGLDLSTVMLTEAATKIERVPPKTLTFARADAELLPLRTASADAVLCLSAFHHYARPQHVLNEVSRILRPKGHLLLLDNVTDGAERWLWTRCLKALFEEDYATFYRKKTMIGMLVEAGLRPADSRTFMHFTNFFGAFRK